MPQNCAPTRLPASGMWYTRDSRCWPKGKGATSPAIAHFRYPPIWRKPGTVATFSNREAGKIEMIPSTPYDWQWSVYEYHRTWIGENSPEGFLVNQLAADNGHYALCSAARYFSVDKSLPKGPLAMHEIAEMALGYDEPNCIENRRNAISTMADSAVEIAANYGENIGRPVSAMSKFLMLLFPNNSFVYDKNARATLAALYNRKEGWLRELGAFFWLWEIHAHPMIEHLRNNNFEHNPAYQDAAGAARIVDKFLWLAARNRPDQAAQGPDGELPECSITQGTAVWNALGQQGLT